MKFYSTGNRPAGGGGGGGERERERERISTIRSKREEAHGSSVVFLEVEYPPPPPTNYLWP